MGEGTHTPAEPRPRRSLWWRLFFVGLGLFLLIGLGVGVVGLVNRARVGRALHEIEQRGEPVVLPAAEPADPEAVSTIAWLRRFADLRGNDDDWDLQSSEGIAKYLARPEAAGLGADDRARLERLAACLTSDPHWNQVGVYELSAEARAALLEGQGPEEWEPCVRDCILTRELEYPIQGELLASPVPKKPLPPAPGRGVERIPQEIRGALYAQLGLFAPIGALAAQGDARRIVPRVLGMLDLRALYERQPGLFSFQLRALMLGRALQGIEYALAQVPPDDVLDALSPVLERIEDEVSACRRAFLEERAIGNEVYQGLSDRAQGSPPGTLRVFEAWMGYDQLSFLRYWSDALAAIDEPQQRGTADALARLEKRMLARAESRWRFASPIAMMLTPRFPATWRTAAETKARRTLVLLALRIRKLPEPAAMAEIAKSVDPFSGMPFHARIDSNSRLRLWSVGANGRDDGAPSELEFARAGLDEESLRDEKDDLVVRVRLR